MKHPDILREMHVLGDDTVQTIVRAEQCEALAARNIAHVAVVDAAAPYTVVRTQLSGAFMQVCLSGEGQTLLDGSWYPHRFGTVSFAPAYVLHAFHCVPAHRWRLAWVRFMPNSVRSIEGALAPTMSAFGGDVLEHAILGLHGEMHGAADPGTCVVWVDVIERYIARILDPVQREPRLVQVWKAVQIDLARDWTLQDLAGMANTSEEHLRRLCQKSLGRSPGKQLAILRISQAAHLLNTTSQKIETIAHSVGYVNSFAFSNAFKRLTGFRPSDYRAKPHGEQSDNIELDGH